MSKRVARNELLKREFAMQLMNLRWATFPAKLSTSSKECHHRTCSKKISRTTDSLRSIKSFWETVLRPVDRSKLNTNHALKRRFMPWSSASLRMSMRCHGERKKSVHEARQSSCTICIFLRGKNRASRLLSDRNFWKRMSVKMMGRIQGWWIGWESYVLHPKCDALFWFAEECHHMYKTPIRDTSPVQFAHTQLHGTDWRMAWY